MDKFDKAILKVLQENASTPLGEISIKVRLSTTPVWRRIEKLKKTGVIRKVVALLDLKKLNLATTVFVSIRTNQHNIEWLERFTKGIKDIPEVVEIYRMSGETDYMLKVIAPDIAGYDAVYKKLIGVAELYDVSSNFAMEQIKSTTVLPLDYVR